MRLSSKLMVMALALVFVFGMTSTVAAFPEDVGAYIDTSEYFGNVPYEKGLNAEIVQLGNNDLADIFQSGENFAHIGQGIDQSLGGVTGDSEDNEAFIEQTGLWGEAEVNQRGELNEANISQSGDENYAGIGQNGDDMVADIAQNAVDSFVRVSQFGGAGSMADITQYGDTNRIRTRQDGYEHSVYVTQEEGSYWNYARVDQTGSYQQADVSQAGEKNSALVEQAGWGNVASVDQQGELNEAIVDQNEASGFSASIMQDGDNNHGTITQTGEAGD